MDNLPKCFALFHSELKYCRDEVRAFLSLGHIDDDQLIGPGRKIGSQKAALGKEFDYAGYIGWDGLANA